MTLNISTWEDFEAVLQGQKIEMEVRKLERGAMVSILPVLQKALKKMDGDITQTKTAKKVTKKKKEVTPEEIIKYMDTILDQCDIQDVGPEIFENHVKNIKGLSIDGQPVTPSQIATEGCLVNLAVDIINQLVSISQLTAQEAKN